MSEKYRQKGGGDLSEREIEAYLKGRMPATFAAVSHVLQEVGTRTSPPIESLLDLGAGPGTGALAAQEVFSGLKKFTLVERNREMIKQGKKFIEAEWIEADLIGLTPSNHDLVLFAYSFGEIPPSSQIELLKRAWDAAQVIVVVEPGTPRGFEQILKAREYLIQWGAEMIAPCPHMKQCPMKDGNWCHFSARLERTREHRQLKGGKLGWEDEKFSYVAFSKEASSMTRARILRHPQKQTGNVVLQLCTDEGLIEKRISKKDGPLYKQARKSKWGDSFTF